MNFLWEFFVGQELKLLYDKVHAHLIHNLRLVYSQMTKNTQKFIPISYLTYSQLVHSQQKIQTLVSLLTTTTLVTDKLKPTWRNLGPLL
jgi:hypothetical protein